MDGDARRYYRLGGTGLLALRARGFKSWGDNPSFLYFGGNSELRGYDYLSFVGQNAFFLNAGAALPADRRDGDADRHPRRHPRHVLRQHRRRVMVAVHRLPLRPATTSGCSPTTPRSRRRSSATTRTCEPIYGDRRSWSTGSACRTRAVSYGISLMTFALGFPIHFDWSWRTLFNREWEDVTYSHAASPTATAPERLVPQAEVHDVDWLRLLGNSALS